MNEIVVFKITSVHTRSIQETGLKVKHRGREFYTGTVVTCLNDHAQAPDNIGIIDLATGAMKIRWSLIATMPMLADAYARGEVDEQESSPLYVVFEEEGHIHDSDDGFTVNGPGKIQDGSLFSGCIVASDNSGTRILPNTPRSDDSTSPSGRKPHRSLTQQILHGEPVHFMFEPEFSTVEVAFPVALGGTKQRLNLVGGFSIRPIMTLPRLAIETEAGLLETVAALA
jgi:hypothetical protein